MQRAVVLIALVAVASAASQVSELVGASDQVPLSLHRRSRPPPSLPQPFTDADRAAIKKYLTGQTLTSM